MRSYAVTPLVAPLVAPLMAPLMASALVGLACGPGVELETGGDASAETSGSMNMSGPTGSGSMTGATANASMTEPEASTTSGVEPDAEGGYEDDGSGTGCTFTCPPPPPPPPGGGTCNCPEGEKCMPWANDGGMEWTGIRCSPVANNPGQPGDPCTVEGNQWIGVDDCDVDAMCWVTDHETNQGTCIGFCSWFGSGPCDEDYECQAQPGDLMLPICVPICDPTAPDCPDGMGCFPGGASFTCQPAAQRRLPVGAPCPDPLLCEAGAMCAFGLDCGQGPGEGCCATVCDTTLPDPCPLPTTCTPWFGEAGSPQWDHVGYCAP